MWTWVRRWLPFAPRRTLRFGDTGEAAAAEFLQRQGWTILTHAHRNRLGELDLIALDGDTVVFVEVKTRRSVTHGGPVDAITPDKQRRLTRAGLAYLKQRGWLNRRSRFDVIAIVWPEGSPTPEITHYRNAFEPTGFGQMYS
jgi:putative endonuclease